MVAALVAHDCRIGNRVVLANNVILAGHVTVELALADHWALREAA